MSCRRSAENNGLSIFQLHLSKLETVSEEEVKSEIHNVQCIYNALSDIKAEVENVIKIGRNVVDSAETDHGLKEKLTHKIDSLKEEFNVAGNEVRENARRRRMKFSVIACH